MPGCVLLIFSAEHEVTRAGGPGPGDSALGDSALGLGIRAPTCNGEVTLVPSSAPSPPLPITLPFYAHTVFVSMSVCIRRVAASWGARAPSHLPPDSPCFPPTSCIFRVVNEICSTRKVGNVPTGLWGRHPCLVSGHCSWELSTARVWALEQEISDSQESPVVGRDQRMLNQCWEGQLLCLPWPKGSTQRTISLIRVHTDLSPPGVEEPLPSFPEETQQPPVPHQNDSAKYLLLPAEPVLSPSLQPQERPLSANQSGTGAAQNSAPTWGSSENQMRPAVDGNKLQKKSTERCSNPRGFLVVVCKARGALRKFSPPVFTSSSLS